MSALLLWLPQAGAESPTPGSPRQLAAIAESLLERDAALEALLLAAAAAAVSPWDAETVEWSGDHEPLGPDARDWGYWMAHRYTVAGSVLSLGASGLLLDRPELSHAAILLLEAQLLSAGLTQALKFSAGRERPDASNELSFPSGHATAAWTTAAILHGEFGPWVGIPAHAAALFVGGSRIQAQKHYPSDVLFGFAVGHWVARAVLRSTDPRTAGERLEWLPPAPARFDGAGLLRVRF